MRSTKSAALGLLVVLSARTALAQTLPSVDARTWKPTSTSADASLVVEPVTSPGAGQWYTAAFLDYTDRPVTLRDAATGSVASRPVETLFGADLVAGVGIGSRAALGVGVPLFLYQDGTGGLPSTIITTGQVPHTGLGDVSIQGKATLISNDKDGARAGLGLAAIATVDLPTGERTSFMGDGSTNVTTRLLAEYALVAFSVDLSVGYKLRTEHDVWPDPSLGGVTFGDELPWSLGATLRPKILSDSLDADDRQTWEIAAHGSLPMGPVLPFGAGDPGSAALSPVMLLASDRVAIGHYKDVFAIAGVDVGLTQAVGTPDVRVVAGIGWAPRAHDQDDDGVPDDIDQCPELPEDRDGIQDEDGCPEDDADGDGVPDTEDACPLVPGVQQSDPRKNGCPGPAPAAAAAASDRDHDGIPDDVDKCPDQPEDLDGFEDGDGCPDPDNDGDGIPDKVDACPSVKGDPSTDPTRNGCPNPDRDGDTFDNDVDRCPDDAEVFNGVQDDDGCPDEGGKPLVVVDTKNPRLPITLAAPIKFTGTAEAPAVDPASDAELRALALELNRRPDWTLSVGARPQPGNAEASQKNALAKAFAVVQKLSAFTHRDGAAETVGWDAVSKQPGSETGLGFLILVAPPSPPAPPPEKPR